MVSSSSAHRILSESATGFDRHNSWTLAAKRPRCAVQSPHGGRRQARGSRRFRVHTITSRLEAFHLPRVPGRVVNRWGRLALAVEFAGIFGGPGAQTCLLYRGRADSSRLRGASCSEFSGGGNRQRRVSDAVCPLRGRRREESARCRDTAARAASLGADRRCVDCVIACNGPERAEHRRWD